MVLKFQQVAFVGDGAND